MAPPTATTRSRPLRGRSAGAPKRGRGRLGSITLGRPAKGKGGPVPVGGATGGRPKPNKFLLGVLGLVAVVAVGRVAMPGMFGGGPRHAVASFPAPLANRHFVHRVTATTVPGQATVKQVTRPGRDPFTPPPGFGPSS
jgi:hypothetical protein